MKKIFNPSVHEFLERHKDITMLGLYWSLAWRFSLFMAILYVIGLIIWFAIVFGGMFLFHPPTGLVTFGI